MIWTICGELYPSRYRAKGMALSTASNWLWNFLLAFFTPFITGAIDFRYGYVFAACNFMGGLIIYFFVLEGQGRTLEELDTMYIEHVIPDANLKAVPNGATNGTTNGVRDPEKETEEANGAKKEETAT